MYKYTIALSLLLAWGCQQNSENSSQADIHDHGLVMRYSFNDPSDEFLGFRPWDKDIRCDIQYHAIKFGLPGNILNRVSGLQFPDSPVKPFLIRWGKDFISF